MFSDVILLQTLQLNLTVRPVLLKCQVLKPGGVLLFRDYCVGDMAQLRFDKKEAGTQKIEENFYVRSDGTRSYYFDEEQLQSLMKRHGLEMVECRVVERTVENVKLKLQMERRWLQAKFRKA